jgi:hypothetical protein
MKKLFLLAAVALFGATTTQAQEFRFGAQVIPVISWMGSNAPDSISGAGSNVGFGIGMFGEYYFGENYAVTSGISINFNHGGKLEYSKGGVLLPNTYPNIYLPAGTVVNYKTTYVNIPLGFKMRTNDLNGLRYFAELPIFTVGIKTQTRGGYGDTSNKNLKSDVNPLTVLWGGGLGAEYNLNEKTSIVGGLYYNSSLIDITKEPSYAHTKISNLGLRIGVVF